MQVILFYNVVYVYVCKIGEEKFGSIQSGRLASALCLSLSQRINWTTVSVLVDSKGNKKSLLVLSFNVLLLQAYEEQCDILLSRFRCKPT